MSLIVPLPFLLNLWVCVCASASVDKNLSMCFLCAKDLAGNRFCGNVRRVSRLPIRKSQCVRAKSSALTGTCAPFGVNPASQVNANECGVLCARLLICRQWAARHGDKFVKYRHFVELSWRRSLWRGIWEQAVSTSLATLTTDVWRRFKCCAVLIALRAQHSKAPSLFTHRHSLYIYIHSVPA